MGVLKLDIASSYSSPLLLPTISQIPHKPLSFLSTFSPSKLSPFPGKPHSFPQFHLLFGLWANPEKLTKNENFDYILNSRAKNKIPNYAIPFLSRIFWSTEQCIILSLFYLGCSGCQIEVRRRGRSGSSKISCSANAGQLNEVRVGKCSMSFFQFNI